MSTFRMLTENFFNIHQFPDHTITASTYQAGNEPWRVGTSRRSARNAWISPTTGEQTLTVECDQVRAADTLVLDRGHNGVSVKIQYTSSTASGFTTLENVTIPTATYTNSKISDTPGVRTAEGAWLYRFATSVNMPAATHWRLAVSSSASGPKVVGAYLGLSFAATALRPYDDEVIQTQRAEVASPEFWSAASRVATRRTGSIVSNLTDLQGDQARYHVGDLFWRGEYGWIVPSDTQADRAVLGFAPSGTRGMPYADARLRTLNLDWSEHQPKPR